MIAQPHMDPTAWNRMRFVVFDIDGTLYDQRGLRIRLARDMVFQAVRSRDLRFLSVIRTYRRIRERLGEEEVVNFETPLIAETVTATGCSEEQVRAIVTEWIEQRPLPYLMACRYPGLVELFAGLKRHGKHIGIFSDYPVQAKLAALGLAADFVVSATDHGIGLLKPHARGLEVLMADAGATAATTVLIGDRSDRDGLAARRAGVRYLIRSSKPKRDCQTFARYDDPLFAPLLSD